jgi:hypothetical protein
MSHALEILKKAMAEGVEVEISIKEKVCVEFRVPGVRTWGKVCNHVKELPLILCLMLLELRELRHE